MIELRWAVSPNTSTKPPVLQYRVAVAVDASGCFCPNQWSDWIVVPTAVVVPQKETLQEKEQRLLQSGFIKKQGEQK